MSSNLNCEFIEISPKTWYYILEDSDAPKNAWDWFEYASAHGPFITFEKAQDHLHKNNSNPGGYNKYPYEKEFVPNESMRKLLDNAIKP